MSFLTKSVTGERQRVFCTLFGIQQSSVVPLAVSCRRRPPDVLQTSPRRLPEVSRRPLPPRRPTDVRQKVSRRRPPDMPAVVCPRCARSFANAGNFSQHQRRCFVPIGHHRPTRARMPASVVVPDPNALPHKWQRVKRKQQLEREVCHFIDICQTSSRHRFAERQTICPFRWLLRHHLAAETY